MLLLQLLSMDNSKNTLTGQRKVLVIQYLAIVVFCVPLAVLPPHDVLMAHRGRCEAKQQSNGKVNTQKTSRLFATYFLCVLFFSS